jgi:mitochondrial import inner membrane translocase subunit TIM17
MAYARKKEDPWNAISAGFLTGGILAARAGAKQMVKNAVVGGVILGLIEGVSIGVSRVLLPMYEQQVYMYPREGLFTVWHTASHVLNDVMILF